MILDAPDDDAPRLVMADQLQAQGDPRGELITIQCTLASKELRAKLNHPQRIALERRERDLLAMFGSEWRREIGLDILESHQCAFRRGFVEMVRVQKPNVLGPLARRDWALSPIREISIETAGVVQKLVDHERLFSTLQTLSVASTGVTPDHFAQIGERFHSLATLTTDASSVAHVQALRGWPVLEQLKIWHPFVEPTSAPRLSSLECLAERISELQLHCICRNPPLDDLHRTLGETVAAAPWSRLSLLDLHLEALGDEGVIALVKHSAHMERLESLVLAAASIGSIGAIEIARSPALANLRKLDLSSNAIGDDGARAIANSTTLTKLEWLDLGKNSITDDGAQAIATSSVLGATLRHLDLGFHPDIRLSVDLFGDDANLSALESIDLHESERMSGGARKALQNRFKKGARLPPRIW